MNKEKMKQVNLYKMQDEKLWSRGNVVAITPKNCLITLKDPDTARQAGKSCTSGEENTYLINYGGGKFEIPFFIAYEIYKELRTLFKKTYERMQKVEQAYQQYKEDLDEIK